MVSGGGHFTIPSTLALSILTCPSSIMKLRNFTFDEKKRHLSARTNRLFSWSIQRMWQPLVTSSSLLSFLPQINKSSIYTFNQPCRISTWKIISIINRNIAGEFVKPKNIMRGSKSPKWQLNVAFHSSPSLIQMLWYPHWMSILIKKSNSPRFPMSSLILGRG